MTDNSNFISPSTESLVRKRAGGQCEWETITGQFQDRARCEINTGHLRCLNVMKTNVLLLCTKHYDDVIMAKASRKSPKKPKPKPFEQTGMFD